MTVKPNRFLRTFNGHNKTAISYARFPFEQLEQFREYIKKSNKYVICNLDRLELKGLLCIENKIGNRYMALRRYNGEAYWNITNIASYVFNDFSDDEIIRFLADIKEHTNIDLTLPTSDFQYIEPTDDTTKLKYTNQTWNRNSMTSYKSLLDIEQIEHGWLDEKN